MFPTGKVPTATTPLLGRSQDLPIIEEQLASPIVRLLTLTGSPGVGKTRLATTAAASLQSQFVDGVYFVDLAPLAAPEDVLTAVAQALMIRESETSSIEEALFRQLRDRQLLLILDNFEHVLPAARLVASLLNRCPTLKVLITSREPLRLRAEHVFTVQALPLPDLQNLPAVKALSQTPAVSLFVTAARARRHDFALTPDNATAVAEICVVLGGLPLAIELSAAWITLFDPATLLDHLRGQLPPPPWHVYDLPERHQTLQAAIEWSAALLTEVERTFFEQMSIFRRGGTDDAARAVSRLASAGELLVLASALVDKNLIRATIKPQGTPRFSMLEPIRRYASARLRDGGAAADVARRHALYFVELAEQLSPQLAGAQQREALQQISLEYDNIRQALGWFIQDEVDERKMTAGEAVAEEMATDVIVDDSTVDESASTNATLGLRLTMALWQYWYICGEYSIGRRWLTLALKAVERTGASIEPATLAEARRRMAVLASRKGDYDWVVATLEAVLAQYRSLNNRAGEATVLTDLGVVQWRQQAEYANVQRLWEEALSIWREIDDRAGVARCVSNLGIIMMEQGKYEQAQRHFEESIALWRVLDNQFFLAVPLSNLGLALHWQGDLNRAARYFDEALQIYRELGDPATELLVLNNVALNLLHQQQLEQALTLLLQKLPRAYEQDDQRVLALMLEGGMRILTAAGQFQMAAQLGGAAEAISPAQTLLTTPAALNEHERIVERLRSQMGRADFEQAWARGQSLRIDELLAELNALDVDALTQNFQGLGDLTAPDDNPLTPREQEVLRLVAEGLSNRQIARRLVISTGTVNVHLANVYAKLEVSSRTAAVHTARESGWL